jgi:Ran GTPase-activating protein (RanGAP) involved in mRNA processing and transport
LNLTACNLQPVSVLYVAKGMAQNTSLHRLILNENIHIGKESLAKLCDALLENKSECKLVDLELSKCAITSESAKHLSKLLNSKIKLRHLNLRDNSIQDDAACEMLGALVNHNFYLTRVNMEYNPIKHQILRDIEAQTKLNVLKVNEQEIPILQNEITNIKARTAGVLHDCSIEPLLKPKLAELFDASTVDAFKRMSVRLKMAAPGRH